MITVLLSLSLLTPQQSTIGPNLTAGNKAISFTATDKNGKTVHFPRDFRGKIVMLDFWGPLCGPCMEEAPNIAQVYNKEHKKGFDILGISLNNKDSLKTWRSVAKSKGMTWDQVTDDKYWQSKVVKLYGVEEIPQAFLVDGSTGKIIAQGNDIRGPQLLPAVQKALRSKSVATK